MPRYYRAGKKTSIGRANRKSKTQLKAERHILNTAPSPNPDAPSNKANMEMNQQIRDDAAGIKPVKKTKAKAKGKAKVRTTPTPKTETETENTDEGKASTNTIPATEPVPEVVRTESEPVPESVTVTEEPVRETETEIQTIRPEPEPVERREGEGQGLTAGLSDIKEKVGSQLKLGSEDTRSSEELTTTERVYGTPDESARESNE